MNVSLDLYERCEERVGTGSFLTDIPKWDTITINEQFYSTFGIGTIVEILYDSGWEKGIIMNDSGNRTYSIYFISDRQELQWTLAENNTATEPGADFKIKPTEWRLAVSLSDIEEADSDARTVLDEAEKEYLTAEQVFKDAEQGVKDAEPVIVQGPGRSSRSQTSPGLPGAKKKLDASKKVLEDAKKVLKVAEQVLSKLFIEYKQHEALINYGKDNSLTGGEMQTDTDELKEIFKKFDKSFIFYGLFRILMACDPIHDFLGGRGFKNCQNFKDGDSESIKIKFRSGIVDAVIDSFVSLFKLVPVTRASIPGPSNKKQKLTEYPPEFLARALLHACLIIINVKLKKNISLKQNLINNLRSDTEAKKLSKDIITAIGLKQVSGNIQRNNYKTGFPTIVDTHEAIDKIYNDSKPQFWKGDIECRVDAIKDHNHFIPIIIGLWNSANITINNDLAKVDTNNEIENAIQTWANQGDGRGDINLIRDVYSTFRKINIERDISTNFDPSFVDSLTKTGTCLIKGSCKTEYDTINFDLTCKVFGISVPILTCSLNSETIEEYAKRKKISDDAAKASGTKKIPQKRKITLNVTNYFGAENVGGKSYDNVNKEGELMGVNKITLNICENQQDIVQETWMKTLGDFLQIMTYLNIEKPKMFVTLDKIASNVASLFDRFVFLEDPSGKSSDDDLTDDLTELYKQAQKGTYIYIPKTIRVPKLMSNVNILYNEQIRDALSLSREYSIRAQMNTSFGKNRNSRFGKKIKAALVQARAYLKKYPFRKKTINMLQVNELRTKLNSVGIKTYVLKSGKKVNLSLRQLQSAANYFKKLQISCKNAGIKLMYNRNGKYYYKSYSRLVNESRKSRKIGKSGKSNKINAMDVNELRTRLNSVGIKTYVLKSGKKVNLPLIQLQRAANYFKKLQIRCKNAGIKLMYKRNGKYYYKSYTRLMSETKRNKFG